MVVMIFLKHVIQSHAGQEEIDPWTLALPSTTHLTGPEFFLQRPNENPRITHRPCTPLKSLLGPLNIQLPLLTPRCLAVREETSKGRQAGREGDNTQLHKYPLEFILIAPFSFKHSRRQKFQFNRGGLENRKTTKEAGRSFRSLWEQSAVSSAVRSMTARTAGSSSQPETTVSFLVVMFLRCLLVYIQSYIF